MVSLITRLSRSFLSMLGWEGLGFSLGIVLLLLLYPGVVGSRSQDAPRHFRFILAELHQLSHCPKCLPLLEPSHVISPWDPVSPP